MSRTSPSFTVTSECGGATELLDSRVSLSFAAPGELGGSSGLTGDGLGQFSGGAQGVKAKALYHDAGCARSGDIVFDPDDKSAKPARKVTVYFPPNSLGLSTTGIKTGPTVTFSALMQLGSDVTWDLDNPVGRDQWIDAKYQGAPRGLEHPAVDANRPGYPTGGVATDKFRIAVGITGCETLEWDQVRSTRVAGIEGFGQLAGQRSEYDNAPLGRWLPMRNGVWVIESLSSGAGGEHLAQCFVTKRGALVVSGAKMHIPFRITAAEIP